MSAQARRCRVDIACHATTANKLDHHTPQPPQDKMPKPLVDAVTHDAVIELLRVAADGINADGYDVPSLLRAAEDLEVEEAVVRAASDALSAVDDSWGGDNPDDDGEPGYRQCLLEAARRLEEDQLAIESYGS